MSPLLPLEVTDALRQACDAGAGVTQGQIDTWCDEWSDMLLPSPTDQELLVLVNKQGQPFSPLCKAPRWVCHLLGLRHQAVHILLEWHSPKAGPMLVCQVRSFRKQDFPGHIDMSVGGHVVDQADLHDTALAEMSEELGLISGDLVTGQLACVGAYACAIERPDLVYFDLEYRSVYLGRIRDLGAIHFQDQEVDGLYLCPVNQAEALLQQAVLPVANGLRLSLSWCLARLNRV